MRAKLGNAAGGAPDGGGVDPGVETTLGSHDPGKVAHEKAALAGPISVRICARRPAGRLVPKSWIRWRTRSSSLSQGCTSN
jgi:hypothetical protein